MPIAVYAIWIIIIGTLIANVLWGTGVIVWVSELISKLILRFKLVVRRSPKLFPDHKLYPECMTCDEEGCIGCPLIEAKEGKKYEG
jgi:hypothetical protein